MTHTILILLAALGTAETVQIPDTQTELGTPALAAVALNAAAAVRTTTTIDVKGRTTVSVTIEYTRGATGAATAITLQCWAGRTKARMGAIPILVDTATLGTSDSYQHIWREPAVTASMVIIWQITPINARYLKCLVDSEGVVTADDVITRIDFRLGRL